MEFASQRDSDLLCANFLINGKHLKRPLQSTFFAMLNMDMLEVTGNKACV